MYKTEYAKEIKKEEESEFGLYGDTLSIANQAIKVLGGKLQTIFWGLIIYIINAIINVIKLYIGSKLL